MFDIQKLSINDDNAPLFTVLFLHNVGLSTFLEKIQLACLFEQGHSYGEIV